MGKRRKSREIAFQLLYALEISGDSKTQVLERFSSLSKDFEPDVWDYALKLFDWSTSMIEDMDKELEETASHWQIDRISKIDKNLIRLGCAEMKKGGVAASIVINEIIEIAKRFGDEDSPRFINGIMDSWYKNYC